MNIPILIGLTMNSTGKKILINACFIEEIMPSVNISDQDDYESSETDNSTILFISGRPAIKVRESVDTIKDMIIRKVEAITVRLNGHFH